MSDEKSCAMRTQSLLVLFVAFSLLLSVPLFAAAQTGPAAGTTASIPLAEGTPTPPGAIGPQSFVKYVLRSQGDRHAVLITLTSSAHDDATTNQVGFDIYAPSGSRTTSIPEHALFHPFDTSSATIALTETGMYLIQVYNYSDGETFGYT